MAGKLHPATLYVIALLTWFCKSCIFESAVSFTDRVLHWEYGFCVENWMRWVSVATRPLYRLFLWMLDCWFLWAALGEDGEAAFWQTSFGKASKILLVSLWKHNVFSDFSICKLVYRLHARQVKRVWFGNTCNTPIRKKGIPIFRRQSTKGRLNEKS